jgi:aryl-alcohol dehydrogenase-like predicted oxidoreductase
MTPGFPGTTSSETLGALDHLVTAGKVRYIGASKLFGRASDVGVGIAERDGLPRFVSQQIYYSLQARDAGQARRDLGHRRRQDE